MYNDDANRQPNPGQTQGSFIRRQIPTYTNGETKPPYRPNPQGNPSYSGGYNSGANSYGGQYGSSQSYQRIQRQPRDMNTSGGYNNYSGGNRNYQTGGNYQRNTGGSYGSGVSQYGGIDRVIKQNDVIIKLLKEIRDRLPPPEGMEDGLAHDNYSGSGISQDNYASGNAESYAENSADENDYGNQDDDGNDNIRSNDNAALPPNDDDDEFNS